VLSSATLLLLTLTAGSAASPPRGVLVGQVVNASRDNAPVPAAEVVLQVRIEGEFVPVEKTRADAGGRFRFASLPLGDDLLYLAGASRDGVHYPGRRVALTESRPAAQVSISVRDTIAAPNPLVIRKHEIVIRGEPGALHVVEAILVDNPGATTFVGAAAAGHEPVTLELSVPAEFERLTFEEEFYGREFSAVNGRVVAGIPWTPGQRWLRYTYSIANQDAYRVWRRKIDLPCDDLRIRVLHDNPDEVTSSLAKAAGAPPGEALFAAHTRLPAGQVIEIGVGRLPLSWTRYARWLAVAALLGAIAVAALIQRWNRPHRSVPIKAGVKRGPDSAAPGTRADGAHAEGFSRKARQPRRRGRRVGN